MPANSGHKIDVDNANGADDIVGQCKEVAELSLAALTRLIQDIDREAAKRGKRGVVFVKLRAGGGVETPILVVQSAASWPQRCVVCKDAAVGGMVCGKCAEAMYYGRVEAK